MNILDVATQPSSTSKRFNNLRRYNALQSLGDMLIAYGAPTKLGENNLNAFMQISEAANKRNQNIMQQEQQFNQASSLLPLVEQYKTSLNLTPERVAQIKANPVANMPFLQALQTNNMSTAFAKTKAINNNLASLQLAKLLGMPMLKDKSEKDLVEMSANTSMQPLLTKYLAASGERMFSDIQTIQLNDGRLAFYNKNNIGLNEDGSINTDSITILGDKKTNTMKVKVNSFDQVKGMWMTKDVILDKNQPDKTNNLGFKQIGETPSAPLFAIKTAETDKLVDAMETLSIPGVDKNSAEYKAAKMFLDKYANQGKMSFELGEDGTFKFTQGMPGDGKLSTKMANTLDEKIFSLGEDVIKLDRILRKFDPKFLTLGGAIDRFKLKMRDWTGDTLPFIKELDKDETKRLGDMTSFFADVAIRFNQILKEMSGAAVMDGEFKRQQDAQPSANDTPTEFAQKVMDQMEFIMGALGRMDMLKKQGISGEAFKQELAKNGASVFGLSVKDGLDHIYDRVTEEASNIIMDNSGLSSAEATKQALDKVLEEFRIPYSFLELYSEFRDRLGDS